MKALMIGCGSVGLALASALYQFKVETHLVARGKTADAIRENGIERCGILGRVVVPPDQVLVFETPEEAEGEYDFILNSAKTTGNADIARSLSKRKADMIKRDGILALFQNGFGNEQAFSEFLPPRQIYQVSLPIGFQRLTPHISEVTVITKPATMGRLSGEASEASGKLAAELTNGGIPCRVTNEFGKTLWAKMLYNCTLNPLSAILGTNYGGLIRSESSLSLMNKMIDEIFAVMHVAGYETFWKDADAYRQDFYQKILPPTYEHHSSTLQDLERKIPTEIDSLNGAVVRLGDQFHVDTPCNTVITQLIRTAESLYHA